MSPVDKQTRNRILAVLFIGVMMGALDIAIVGPAMSALKEHFAVDERLLGWTITVYILFNLVGTPLMAKLSDAYGRRAIYILDVALFAAGSLVVALAPTFAWLLAGRAVQGLGSGGVFPVASAVIGDTFPPERRGTALGMIGAVFGVAFLIGPVLAGLVLRVATWRWLFLINLPVAAAVIVAAWRVLPGARHGARQPLDTRGMVLLAALLAALAYGLNGLDADGLGALVDSVATRRVWPFLVVAAALLPIFWRVERQAADPVLRTGLLSTRQVTLTLLLAAGAGLAEGAVVFVPDFLVATLGVTESDAALMLLPVVLAMAIGAPLAGRALDRFGSRRVVRTGVALLTIGLATIGVVETDVRLFYLAGTLGGLGFAVLLGAPLRYIMLNEAKADERAAAQGALSLFTNVGTLLAGALVGAIAGSFGEPAVGYRTAFLSLGGVGLGMLALTLGLKGRQAEGAVGETAETVGGQPV